MSFNDDEQSTGTEVIEGEVKRMKRFDDGYTIMDIQVSKGKIAKVVGGMPRFAEGMNVRASVIRTNHAKYGQQFKVVEIVEIGFSNMEAIVSYLSSPAFPGIGVVIARAIVNHFGMDTLKILDTEPERVEEVKAVPRNKCQIIIEQWQEQRSLHKQMSELVSLGITVNLAMKISKYFAEGAMEIIKTNAYRLIEIPGIGFLKADEIAIRMGVDRASMQRVHAAVKYVLEESLISGDCFQILSVVAEKTVTLLQHDVNHLGVNEALKELVKNGSVVVEERNVYLSHIYAAEKQVAEQLRDMISYRTDPLYPTIDKLRERLATLNFEITLAPEQEEAIFNVMNSRVAIITGGPGTGKAQPLDTPILTPKGYVLMSEINEGDFVIGSNGLPTRVLSVHPQGVKDVYRITFNDRTSTECCGDHLWAIQNKKSKFHKTIKVMSTEDIRQHIDAHADNPIKLYVPILSAPVVYDTQDTLLVHPYVLGVIVGDNAVGTSESLGFTTANTYIPTIVSSFLPDSVRVIKIKDDSCCEYSIINPDEKPNIILGALRDYGLFGGTAGEKSIPQAYLQALPQERLELLQGMMDISGITEMGRSSYNSVSKRLAEDFQQLAMSLGCKATLIVKKATGKEEHPLGFRVIVAPPPGMNLFRVPAKMNTEILQVNNPPVRTIRSVLYSRMAECQCIRVAAADSLYCTNDFILTHNTTMMKCLVALFDYHDISYELCSPTGRASKRMTEATQRPARTIHRLLEVSPSGGFVYREGNPLNTNAVVVDEISMVDVMLMRHLLDAMENNQRLILVGDADQLPSVGPGSVLRDLIASGKVPTVKLQRIFRQDKGSAIVVAAHNVLHGEMPHLPTPKNRKGGNCMFVGASDISELIQHIIFLAGTALPNFGINSNDIQILTPMRERGLGVNDLNPELQRVLNPASPDKDELQANMRIFRVGDRVMQTSNDYKKGVFNGDMGILAGITRVNDTATLHVQYPDMEIPIPYVSHEWDALLHSWAVTVHKCLPHDQRVYTRSRGSVPISDLVVGEYVWTGQSGYRPIKAVVPTGMKSVKRITTCSGYTLEASEEHPLLTLKNGAYAFEKVSDLTTGTVMCLSRHQVQSSHTTILPVPPNVGRNTWNPAKVLDAELAWLLGVIVGDGCYSDRRDGRVSITNKDQGVICRVAALLRAMGLSVFVHEPHGCKTSIVSVTSKSFRVWLREIGIDYVTAKNKAVPHIIFGASPTIRGAFLRGLFDTDGGSHGERGLLRLISLSEAMSEQVQEMLLGLGIVSVRDFRKSIALWCVTVSGQSLIRFACNVDFTINYKHENNFQGRGHQGRGKTNNDVVPVSADTLHAWESECVAAGGQAFLSQANQRIGAIASNLYRRAKSLSYNQLGVIARHFLDAGIDVPSGLSQILKDEYYFDAVSAVEDLSQKKEMYDIEVEDMHSFAARGFVCHNSQGSEYPAVILVCHPSQANMLQRNWFYTGITRAKKWLVIAGTEDGVSMAVNNTKERHRNTTLMQRMQA